VENSINLTHKNGPEVFNNIKSNKNAIKTVENNEAARLINFTKQAKPQH
jgi:hypothetical protein